MYGVERAAALLQVNRYKTVLNDDDRVNGRPAALADASGLSDAQGIAYDLSIVLLTDLHRQAN